MRKYSLAVAALGLMLCGGVLQANGMPGQLGGASQATIGGAPLNVLSLTTSQPRGAVNFVGGATSNAIVSPFPSGPGMLNPPQISMSLQSVVMPTSGTIVSPQPITVGGALTIQPLAKISVTQMMPPAPVNYVPPVVQNLTMKLPVTDPKNPGGSLEPQAIIAPQPGTNNLEIAGKRPDFRYNPGRIEFKPETTHTTGQHGMGVGPGLPPGAVRYVPVGEF